MVEHRYGGTESISGHDGIHIDETQARWNIDNVESSTSLDTVEHR